MGRVIVSDLPGAKARKLVSEVLAAQGRFEGTVDEFDNASLAGTSRLAGWSRAQLVAHVAYGAVAARRTTEAARDGVHVPFYPRGEIDRRASIDRGLTMPPELLRAELIRADGALGDLWKGFRTSDWARPLRDDNRFPGAAIARHLVLRWTEVEVHRADLEVLEHSWERWAPAFVEVALPLRIAWQPLAAGPANGACFRDGRWAIVVPSRGWRWVITRTAGSAAVVASVAQGGADVEISGTPSVVLAFLLGRATCDDLSVDGDMELARRYKQAFPGP
jgi:hypothetical protein